MSYLQEDSRDMWETYSPRAVRDLLFLVVVTFKRSQPPYAPGKLKHLRPVYPLGAVPSILPIVSYHNFWK